jgi:hypothetical protein
MVVECSREMTHRPTAIRRDDLGYVNSIDAPLDQERCSTESHRFACKVVTVELLATHAAKERT